MSFPINCKISSDINVLNKYNKLYEWIPNELNIRHIESVLNDKAALLNKIKLWYVSMLDYILITIFGAQENLSDEGKIYASEKKKYKNNYKFTKNIFPYNLPNDTNHYIMWFYGEKIIDTDINDNISIEITKLKGDNNFKFIWYKNPKMNISEIYHVQVFWISD